MDNIEARREEFRKILLSIKPDIDGDKMEEAIDKMIAIQDEFIAYFKDK